MKSDSYRLTLDSIEDGIHPILSIVRLGTRDLLFVAYDGKLALVTSDAEVNGKRTRIFGVTYIFPDKLHLFDGAWLEARHAFEGGAR